MMCAMTISHAHGIDAATIAVALADRAEYVAIALLGKPSSKSRDELRWGRHGSISMRLSGTNRGRWRNFERGVGGAMSSTSSHTSMVLGLVRPSALPNATI